MDENLKTGDVVFYRLRARQWPIHPDKLWRGKVVYRYRSFKAVLVQCLESGYEDDDAELVFFSQIQGVGKRAHS